MTRVKVTLGGKVGELDLFDRDLADLCDLRPNTAGEWVSGGIERISLIDLAMICEQLELEIGDVLVLERSEPVPPPEGRTTRIMSKVVALRQKRRAAAAMQRALKRKAKG